MITLSWWAFLLIFAVAFVIGYFVRNNNNFKVKNDQK